MCLDCRCCPLLSGRSLRFRRCGWSLCIGRARRRHNSRFCSFCRRSRSLSLSRFLCLSQGLCLCYRSGCRSLRCLRCLTFRYQFGYEACGFSLCRLCPRFVCRSLRSSRCRRRCLLL